MSLFKKFKKYESVKGKPFKGTLENTLVHICTPFTRETIANELTKSIIEEARSIADDMLSHYEISHYEISVVLREELEERVGDEEFYVMLKMEPKMKEVEG